MKIRVRFRLQHTLLTAALLASPRLFAQAKPGMPQEEMKDMHAAKVRTTAFTLTLTSQTPARLPAAGGSLALGDKTLTLQAADLSAMPHESVMVINGHTKASETYSGVSIAALLARLGIPFEKANEHTLLKTYLLAEGSDGYKVVLSAYETLFAIRETTVIVADTLVTPEGSKPLDRDGAFKLIIPGDKRPQRWVQNLKSLSFKIVD